MSAAPLVVLLHGLARGHASLSRLRAALERAGFATWARTYPSRHTSIAAAAAALCDELAQAADGRPLHAVTHSLGGVVLRHMHDPRLDWRRAVMLAPPNQGSTLARGLASNPLFAWFYGPAGVELGLASEWPLPPVPEVAVIAGTRQLALGNPVSWTFGRRLTAAAHASDGTVTVAETRLPSMRAFTTVDATHTWIMNDARAQALVVAFLRDGNWG